MSRLFKLFTPLLAIMLVACGDTSASSENEFPTSEFPSSEISSSESPSSETPSSEIPSSEQPSSELPPSSEIPSSETPSSELPPSSEIPSSEQPSSETPSSETPSESSSSPSSEIEDGKERVALTFNAANYNYKYNGSKYYDTGSFGVGSLNNYNFEHYRVARGNKAIALLPYYEDRNEYEIGGSLTNSVGFLGINQITFTYSTSGDTGALPRLYTSDTLLFEDYIEFPLSVSQTTKTIKFAPRKLLSF